MAIGGLEEFWFVGEMTGCLLYCDCLCFPVSTVVPGGGVIVVIVGVC